jgi:hypothetical protein
MPLQVSRVVKQLKSEFRNIRLVFIELLGDGGRLEELRIMVESKS